MIAMAGVDLPAKAARSQVASAIGVIVQANRLADGTRKLTSVQEITGMEGETVALQEIFYFQQTGVSEAGRVQGHFTATGIRPRLSDRLTSRGIPLPSALFEPHRLEV
jgi:pilus assembly protein CpaF